MDPFEPQNVGYRKIARIIRSQILDGTYKVGDLLPSENEMVKTFNVSRVTINRAVTLLRNAGLVDVIRGVGAFVARPPLPKHHVSVAAVVIDHGHVLVIQRSDTAEWQIPGGILEPDERIEAGVQREVLEEAGVEVQVRELTGVYKNMRLNTVALVFLATVVRGSGRPTDEASAVEWWDRNEVQERMAPMFAIRVLDALDERSGPTVRDHDGTRLLP